MQSSPPYDRFPLPAGSGLNAGIAELRRLFMVDVRDVKPEDRIGTLTDALAEQLAVTVSAYTSRRGPLVAWRNALKLASLLSPKGSSPSLPVLTASLRVAQVVADSWSLEGDALDAVTEVSVDDGRGQELAATIIGELRRLRDSAEAAARALEAV